MALPLSGPLSINMIRNELQIPSKINFSHDTAENDNSTSYALGYPPINKASYYRPTASNPAAISEWYGYDHTAVSTAYFYFSVNINSLTGSNQYIGAIRINIQRWVWQGFSYTLVYSSDFYYGNGTVATAIYSSLENPIYIVGLPASNNGGIPDRYRFYPEAKVNGLGDYSDSSIGYTVGFEYGYLVTSQYTPNTYPLATGYCGAVAREFTLPTATSTVRCHIHFNRVPQNRLVMVC